ncbi:hypothetical protein FRC14_006551 [Serendipita sp. 396]|nr:hypothetical protein FRC14_006551 [Serendipita sp. 396]
MEDGQVDWSTPGYIESMISRRAGQCEKEISREKTKEEILFPDEPLFFRAFGAFSYPEMVQPDAQTRSDV